jgi:hypothetical protein
MKQILVYIAIFISGTTIGRISETPPQSLAGVGFDCKGQECQVQVFAKKEYVEKQTVMKCSDAIYYKPDVWNEKTEEELEADKNSRCDKWKAFVDEQSKKETNEEIE